MKRKDKFRVIKSDKSYWDWVGNENAEEGGAEPAKANPDMLPEPVKEKATGEKVLKLRAIREAELTEHEVLIINLLVDNTQEQVAKQLNISRGAVTGALLRAQEKIERKLAVLRTRALLANQEINGLGEI